MDEKNIIYKNNQFICQSGKIYRGVYCISFTNGKKYIGISNNIRKRINEHISDAKHNDLLPVHKAINKYNFIIELLEQCQSESRQELNKKERFWIKKLNTYNKNYGYNLTIGGDGAQEGYYNLSAKFNKQQIQEIYDLLINRTDLYIYEIAAKYNISPESLSDINNGKRYYNSNLTYPLRSIHHIPINKPGTESNVAKFNKQQIQQIYLLLKNSNKTFQQIAKEYNTCYAVISNINRGITYKNDKITYPIRIKKIKTCKLSEEQIDQIINLLINTKISISEIGKIFQVSPTTIGRIRDGKSRKRENLKYPLRKKK